MAGRKFLGISPHVDDIAIGAGGFAINRIAQGDEFHILYVTLGVDASLYSSIREEGYGMAARLGANPSFLEETLEHSHRLGSVMDTLQSGLIRFIRKLQPDYILAPHEDDGDPDHAIVHRAATNAYWMASHSGLLQELGQPLEHMSGLLGYEVSMLHGLIAHPNYHERLEDPVMDAKLQAIETCKSQLTQVRYGDIARALGILRGGDGINYCEAFTLREMRDLF